MNRLCRTYVALVLAPEDAAGTRIASLARFGAYAVRMVETASGRATPDVDFHLELYCTATRSSLYRCRCRDLDQAETIADHLVACARRLDESHSGPGLSFQRFGRTTSAGSFSDSVW